MRIAWFRSTPLDAADPLDDSAALIAELRSRHAIDVVLERDAHDFVWRQILTPWDLCVYELDNSGASQFAWAYLVNYSGVTHLKSRTLHDSRAAALDGRLDAYAAEFRFNHRREPPFTWRGRHHAGRGSWPMLRAPLLASRSVVVPHAAAAQSLQEEYPEAQVRFAPCSVGAGLSAFATPSADGQTPRPYAAGDHACRFGVLDLSRLDVIERACHRAQDAGARIELLKGESAGRVLAESDVIVALSWPTFDEPLTAALAGMAAGKPVVAFELHNTADWPALDPQTGRPRGIADALDSTRAGAAAPIVVAIDPRDEEHSLMLAMRRLAGDAVLRGQLGRAAEAWWRAHATPAHAASAWNQILEEAVSLAPPRRPEDWPPHLSADGTGLARTILAEFQLPTPNFQLPR
jgi:hypothetical protein